MRKTLCLLVFLFLSAPLFAKEIVIDPPVIKNGEVSLLRWIGAPPTFAVARFNNQLYYLSLTEKGATALLGSDVEQPPGIYPIQLSVVDKNGTAAFYQSNLEIKKADRPEERLSLPPHMVSPKEPEVIERIIREKKLLTDLFSKNKGQFLLNSFSKPVEDPISSPFGLRRILNGAPRSPHAGIDFRSPKGRPAKASAEGYVVFAGDLYFTGNTVILDHGAGLYSLYAHLDNLLCRENEFLQQGQILGKVGSTGRSTGPHLHWGAKLRGNRVDPLSILKLLNSKKP